MPSALAVLGTILVILLPIALLLLVFMYLRRTAPGGTVPAPAPEGPAPAMPATAGPAARVRGAVTCRGCGMAVTPAAHTMDIARCPNCNTALPMA